MKRAAYILGALAIAYLTLMGVVVSCAQPAPMTPVPTAPPLKGIVVFVGVGGSEQTGGRNMPSDLLARGWAAFARTRTDAITAYAQRSGIPIPTMILDEPWGQPPYGAFQVTALHSALGAEPTLATINQGFVAAWLPWSLKNEVICYSGGRVETDRIMKAYPERTEEWFLGYSSAMKPAYDARMSVGLDAVSTLTNASNSWIAASTVFQATANYKRVAVIEPWPTNQSAPDWRQYDIITSPKNYTDVAGKTGPVNWPRRVISIVNRAWQPPTDPNNAALFADLRLCASKGHLPTIQWYDLKTYPTFAELNRAIGATP